MTRFTFPLSAELESQLLLAVPVLGMVSLFNYSHSSQRISVFYVTLAFHTRCIVVLICTSRVLSIFSCVYLLLLHLIWHLCQIQVHSDILSVFLEMSQLQLSTLSTPYDTFQINYFYIVWIKGLSVIILHMLIQLFQQHLLKRLSFSHWIALALLSKSIDCIFVDLFLWIFILLIYFLYTSTTLSWTVAFTVSFYFSSFVLAS